MIYIDNITYQQEIWIPVNEQQDGELLLHLHSCVNLTAYTLDLLQTRKSQMYVVGKVTLPAGVSNGDYEYTLTCRGKALSKGMMTIGNDNEGAKEYNINIEYEQYEG